MAAYAESLDFPARQEIPSAAPRRSLSPSDGIRLIPKHQPGTVGVQLRGRPVDGYTVRKYPGTSPTMYEATMHVEAGNTVFSLVRTIESQDDLVRQCDLIIEASDCEASGTYCI